MHKAFQDPHAGQPVLQEGPSAGEARLAVILVHGRGSSAGDMMGLAGALRLNDILYLAPEAANHTWYPHRFLAPIPENEPWLSSALGIIDALVVTLGAQGIPPERIGVLGFSQGACLSLEYAARHARRYAGVFGLSGGLIGPPGTPREYGGSMQGTPVFLGCSDIDQHIPVERVHESADVFRRLGSSVDERIYPGMAHTVTADQMAAVRSVLGTSAVPTTDQSGG